MPSLIACSANNGIAILASVHPSEDAMPMTIQRGLRNATSRINCQPPRRSPRWADSLVPARVVVGFGSGRRGSLDRTGYDAEATRSGATPSSRRPVASRRLDTSPRP